jgi:hypothetical protein
VNFAPVSFENQGQFSVNGQRANANYFMVDGVSGNFGASGGVRQSSSAGGALPSLSSAGGTNSLVSVEALQEFRISTSTFAPEFGRQPGAQIQIVTRSGTNRFQGTAFHYFRNDLLDANDWFANRNRLGKPPIRLNNIGGVLGGPVRRNRTFFFGSYENQPLRQPATGIVAVPTLEARAASPAALRPYLDAIPGPNTPVAANGIGQFAASWSNPSDLQAGSVRIDEYVNSKVTIFGRYNYAPSSSRSRQLGLYAPNSINNLENLTETVTIGSTQVLTPRLTHDARYNFSRARVDSFFSVDNFGGAVPVPADVLYPSFTEAGNRAVVFQVLSAAGFFDGQVSTNSQRQHNAVSTWSYSVGSHQFRFGADFRWLLPTTANRQYDLFYRFNGVNGPFGIIGGRMVDSFVRGFPNVDFGFSNQSAFWQDTWRISRRLTLTYGLRWDRNTPPTGRNGFTLYTLQGLADPATATLAPAGTPFYSTRNANFAPRVGLSFALRESGHFATTLRAGFGLFYDLGVGQAGSATDNVYQRARVFTAPTFPLSQEAMRPVAFPPAPPYPSFFVADPNLETPFSRQWNFAMEQGLGQNQTLSITYLGSSGSQLLRTLGFNNPSPVVAQLSLMRNGAESSYHSLQTQFRRNLHRSVQALVSWTWGHSIDSTSGDQTVFTAAPLVDENRDRGPSDFDIRHSLQGAITWRPAGWRTNAFVRRISSNWGVDTVFRAQSALPVNVVESRPFPGVTGNVVLRPDLVSGQSLFLENAGFGGGKVLNRAAFARVSELRQGTLGRNAVRAFPLQQIDIALNRRFALREKLNLDLRVEAFNVTNKPSFAAPVSDLINPLFGQSTAMYGRGLGQGGAVGGLSPLYQIGGPRSLQLALRLQF